MTTPTRLLLSLFLASLTACSDDGAAADPDAAMPDQGPAADMAPPDATTLDALPLDLADPDATVVDARPPLDLPSPDSKLTKPDLLYFKDQASGTVSETVTCRFVGSTSTQKCYSSTGASCAGVTSCQVKMTGYSGTAVSWKSSCGGTASTTLDGKNEAVVFTCAASKDLGVKPDKGLPQKDLPSGQATEVVTCRFSGSSKTQTCYSSSGHTCSGVVSCPVTVTGKSGLAITWKSSCGGYAYTTLDGKDEAATFTCP